MDAELSLVDDSAAFHGLEPSLDETTNSKQRFGNRAELLVNGTTSFTRRYENAATADLILVKTYAFLDDETGRHVASILEDRARAGAFVVLQYDVGGSLEGSADLQRSLLNGAVKPIIQRLRDAGVTVVAANAPVGPVDLSSVASASAHALFHPFDTVDTLAAHGRGLAFRDHEKYWITGKYSASGELVLDAIMGGMNIGSEYALGGSSHVDSVTGAHGWHDVDVEVTGPVVNDIAARFFDVMDAQRGTPRDDKLRQRWNPPQPIAGNAGIRFVYNHPRFGNLHTIESLYARLIEAVPAGNVIRIEAAYFAPSSEIRRQLHAALERGTRLAVITNLETSDAAPVAEGTWFAYHALLDLNRATALYGRVARPDLGEVMIHCKVASFGTRGPVIIGSANLDAQSGEHNSEGVLLIDDPEFRAKFDAMYSNDYSSDRAQRITLERLEQDSSWRQLEQWAIWQLAWYWL